MNGFNSFRSHFSCMQRPLIWATSPIWHVLGIKLSYRHTEKAGRRGTQTSWTSNDSKETLVTVRPVSWRLVSNGPVMLATSCSCRLVAMLPDVRMAI